jgi:hypothetical protein
LQVESRLGAFEPSQAEGRRFESGIQLPRSDRARVELVSDFWPLAWSSCSVVSDFWPVVPCPGQAAVPSSAVSTSTGSPSRIHASRIKAPPRCPTRRSACRTGRRGSRTLPDRSRAAMAFRSGQCPGSCRNSSSCTVHDTLARWMTRRPRSTDVRGLASGVIFPPWRPEPSRSGVGRERGLMACGLKSRVAPPA